MEDKSSKTVKKWAVFSGIAFQMAAIITIGVFLGVTLDDYFQKDKLFTTICSLSAVILSIYFVIKKVIKLSEE